MRGPNLPVLREALKIPGRQREDHPPESLEVLVRRIQKTRIQILLQVLSSWVPRASHLIPLASFVRIIIIMAIVIITADPCKIMYVNCYINVCGSY